MRRIVLLDAGPLGLVTNPKPLPEVMQCQHWLETLLLAGVQVVVPEIADDEVRRELLRAGKVRGIRHLDRLKATLDYRPMTTDVMLKAAEFWAQTRRLGRPTADDSALDGDVILAAQAFRLQQPGNIVTVATMNVAHLARFVAASHWYLIA